MRVKTFFLIAMVSVYGYYLHAMSRELTRRVDGLKVQYSTALAQVSVEGASVSRPQAFSQYTASK